MHDVALAYMRFDTVTGNFLDSVMDLIAYDLSRSQRIGVPIRTAVPSMGIIEGANKTVETFLAGDQEWLFWLDCDMGFAPDVLDRLMAAVDPIERPAVGALVFKYHHLERDNCNGVLAEERPVILDWGMDESGQQGFMCRRTYPENALIRCDATGMACAVIHRSVHEAILAEYGPVWHTPLPWPGNEGAMLGPDVSFWARAAQVDKPLHVHTGAHTNHAKTIFVSHASYSGRLATMGFTPHDGTEAERKAPPVGTPVQNRAERRRLAKANG